MKNVISVMLIVITSALFSGCASMIVTSVHNRNVETRASAFRVQANAEGARAALDLMSLKGYFGAWKENPTGMAIATGLDIGTGLTAGYLYNQDRKDDSGSSSGGLRHQGDGQISSFNVTAGNNSTISINNSMAGDDRINSRNSD